MWVNVLFILIDDICVEFDKLLVLDMFVNLLYFVCFKWVGFVGFVVMVVVIVVVVFVLGIFVWFGGG